MISKLRLIAMAILVVSPMIWQTALADSMRCGTHIVSAGSRSGPDKYEVLKKCGEPTVRSGSSWIYESYGSKRVLVFDETGTLVRISS